MPSRGTNGWVSLLLPPLDLRHSSHTISKQSHVSSLIHTNTNHLHHQQPIYLAFHQKLNFLQHTHTKPTNSTTMAAFTLLFTPATAVYGRSGYNKDGDDEEKDSRGRSGYNKDGDDDDEDQNKGRSGYNKDGDDEEDK
ncbi:hypothetical protein CLIM01_07409 [Colletotrichum limetticola]|uniref:Uncharacterized protein n=1 Tax=Colletotrichum limetticola TaxID=1209924 RepID=A0ABQ9PUM1_9PEZI|nr:hypothetical protein CLIM01_07409 [Colletotrichum limetticola]